MDPDREAVRALLHALGIRHCLLGTLTVEPVEAGLFRIAWESTVHGPDGTVLVDDATGLIQHEHHSITAMISRVA